MTSTKKQNRNRLLYWKKIILTAESHTGAYGTFHRPVLRSKTVALR